MIDQDIIETRDRNLSVATSNLREEQQKTKGRKAEIWSLAGKWIA